jgi:hypothetical protein
VSDGDQQWARVVAHRLLNLDREVSETKILLGKLLIDNVSNKGPLADIREAEFKVFSQFGEDGIIHYLIRRSGINVQENSFVEFGVQNYQEANTRFLLINDNWRGLVMDAGEANIASVQASSLYWRHDLTAKCSFINTTNINSLIAEAGFEGPVGVLSIDIDGNDYWIWERIDIIDPVIVVVEYNSVFGSERAVTIPYDPAFVRGRAHHSHLYYGCSLKALERLGERKGYSLVGSNSAGSNAFFVKSSRLNGQPAMSAQRAYVQSRFRESRDARGRLTYVSGPARHSVIGEMPVWDLETNSLVQVSELFRTL